MKVKMSEDTFQAMVNVLGQLPYAQVAQLLTKVADDIEYVKEDNETTDSATSD